MTREQKLESAFFALLDDYFYTDDCSPCEYCPLYRDPGSCPAVYEFDDDIPFADYCVHRDVCRELILQYYIDKAAEEEDINEEY